MVDISIVMPCLNEAECVGFCIEKASNYCVNRGLSYEIIVVDNGSTDGSAEIAKSHGAIVLSEDKRGYGNALRTGISATTGSVVVIGDCDTTYDFGKLDNFYYPIAQNKVDMVVGNRYAQGFDKGAMPLSHKLGVRFLSICGRIKYRVAVYDYHCGLRAVDGNKSRKIPYETTGMEFATEMIAKAKKYNLRIGQTPVKLRVCSYKRVSKLRTVKDGFRHLIFIIKGSVD